MRTRFLAIGMAAGALALALSTPAVVGRTAQLLEFQRMTGVPATLTGANGSIRGVNGAGLPWVIGSAKGELSVDGRLELKFSDLLFDPASQAVVDRGLQNTNNQATMRAAVTCEGPGMADVVVLTDPFPVTTGLFGGDGRVEAWLTLPSPCIAPIVLITNAAGTAWFAAMGG